MVKINKKIHIAKIINVILILLAIGGNIYAITLGNMLFTDFLSVFLTVAALICAMIYTIKGYRKEDIKIFKAFIIMCIFTLLLQLGGEIYYLIVEGLSILKSSIISIFSLVLDIVLLIILITIKDLEKNAALTFAGTIVTFTIFNFIRTVTVYQDFPGYIALTFSGIVLACIICVSVAAKYKNDDSTSPQ